MSKGWSLERRMRQAALIHNWQPWKQATGPKTKEGKRCASHNAYKGSEWLQLRQEIKRLKQLMREQQRMVEETMS